MLPSENDTPMGNGGNASCNRNISGAIRSPLKQHFQRKRRIPSDEHGQRNNSAQDNSSPGSHRLTTEITHEKKTPVRGEGEGYSQRIISSMTHNRSENYDSNPWNTTHNVHFPKGRKGQRNFSTQNSFDIPKDLNALPDAFQAPKIKVVLERKPCRTCNKNDDPDINHTVDLENEYITENRHVSETEYEPLSESEEDTAENLLKNLSRNKSPKTKTIFSLVHPSSKVGRANVTYESNAKEEVLTEAEAEETAEMEDFPASVGDVEYTDTDTNSSATDDTCEIQCKVSKETSHGSEVASEFPVGKDTLVFTKCDSSMSRSAKIRMENGTDWFLQIKVYCNHTALGAFSVTPSMGIIPPGNAIYLTIKTKKCQKPLTDGEMVMGAKFIVEAFPTRLSDRSNLSECYNISCMDCDRHMIFTHTFDKIIALDMDQDFDQSIDKYSSCRNTSVSKESTRCSDDSTKMLKSKFSDKIEMLKINQRIRNQLEYVESQYDNIQATIIITVLIIAAIIRFYSILCNGHIP